MNVPKQQGSEKPPSGNNVALRRHHSSRCSAFFALLMWLDARNPTTTKQSEDEHGAGHGLELERETSER